MSIQLRSAEIEVLPQICSQLVLKMGDNVGEIRISELTISTDILIIAGMILAVVGQIKSGRGLHGLLEDRCTTFRRIFINQEVFSCFVMLGNLIQRRTALIMQKESSIELLLGRRIRVNALSEDGDYPLIK